MFSLGWKNNVLIKKRVYITRLRLAEVFNSIVLRLDQDIQTGNVYLDLYKAFDSVCHARFQ